MAATYRYFVCRYSDCNDKWFRIPGSEGNRSYACGWFDALTSFYPRPAYQLLQYNNPDTTEVIEESSACRAPQPQRTN